ncbi:tumor necrosis factor ligand superfamily member 10 [Bombina bombina]|uniref:tumor necrosis factor ligand superfamily member 10 n=1 Tax=Bombina bombina TaxID=8345 RepID=UPI00235AFDE1|nr:tumor necrosis factor ligand superfamily member 10 [Bombina bombina]
MNAASFNSFPLCGLILLLSFLLQSVFVAVTYIYFSHEHKQLREAYTRSNIACLIGEDIGDFFQSTDILEAQNDPCWEVKFQLQTLIKKIMFKNFNREMSKEIKDTVSETLPFIQQTEEYRAQVVAAHVTGNNRKVPSPQESTMIRNMNGHKINVWKFFKHGSFLNNLEMEHGDLIIKKSGFYYVYAQIYFRLKTESRKKNEGKQILQQIYKVSSYPDPILLMKNAKTACWSENAEYGLHSIYQGGVFKLNENDRIFVAVNDVSLIDMDENATFFGAFLVG